MINIPIYFSKNLATTIYDGLPSSLLELLLESELICSIAGSIDGIFMLLLFPIVYADDGLEIRGLFPDCRRCKNAGPPTLGDVNPLPRLPRPRGDADC